MTFCRFVFILGLFSFLKSDPVFCSRADDDIDNVTPKLKNYKKEKTKFKTQEIELNVSEEEEEKLGIHGIPYTLKFKGNLTDAIVEDLKKGSQLLKLANYPPSSITGLGKRADQDKKKFRKILAAHGYLGAKVAFRLSEKDNRVVVKFTIHSGDVYKISNINFDVSDNPYLFKSCTNDLLSAIVELYIGDDVSFNKIIQSVKLLKNHLQLNGYPFVEVEKPIGYVEHKKKSLNITFKIRTGILAFINKVSLSGLKSIQEPFIRNRFIWKEKEQYSIELFEKTKAKLADTQLIASTIFLPEPDLRECVLDQNQQPIPQPLDFKATINEGPPRAIGAGLRYSMAEKLGGKFYWHHNNLLGNQEHFGLTFKSSALLKKLKVVYELFDVLSPLQTLSYEAVLQKDNDSLSYTGDTQSFSTTLSRPVFSSLSLKASIGVLYENANLKQYSFLNPVNNFKDAHKILGVPVSISFDTTNNKLDPAKGIRAFATITPFTGTMQDTKSMIHFKAGASHYLSLHKTPLGDPLFVVASFIHFGTMYLSKTAPPPLNKRFFAGGSGSVRGYGLKRLSPFAPTTSNTVIFLGGRSYLEFGTELRYRINSDWGCVAFIEGATVDTAVNNVQNTTKTPLLWGPGFGIRYFTEFAPIRLDLAFPTQKRRDTTTGITVDAPFQFYISIGQAF
ncbi:MAG: BamA/TamA family outer membrane protein [Proteobacteria bacterium]|nr:BamA/TamA family outer membrane protein [Pseudomonadota bacterium]